MSMSFLCIFFVCLCVCCVVFRCWLMCVGSCVVGLLDVYTCVHCFRAQTGIVSAIDRGCVRVWLRYRYGIAAASLRCVVSDDGIHTQARVESITWLARRKCNLWTFQFGAVYFRRNTGERE